MSIAEDASTPAIATLTTSSGVATSSTFSPVGNSVVVVACVYLFNTNNASASITCKDSNSNNYTRLIQGQDATGATNQAIFWFAYTPAQTNITITLTETGSSTGDLCFTAIRVLTGADPAQSGAGTPQHATGTSTAWTGSITTAKTGSLVYTTAGSTGSVASLVAAANTTIPSGGTNISNGAGDSGGIGKATSLTGTPGATTFGFTSGTSEAFGWLAAEIVPATATAIIPTDPSQINPGPAWQNYYSRAWMVGGGGGP